MNKLILTITFLFLATRLIVGQWPTFSAHVLSTSLAKAAATDIADFNNDGFNDIVAGTSDQSGEISLWLNNAEQSFTKTVIESGYPGARHLMAVDLDKDSNIDIVSVAYYSNQIVWLKNDGAGNFEKIILAENFSNPHTVDVKDINNDGNLDIMCSGAGSDGSAKEVAWWENDGEQNFEKHLLTGRFTKSCFIEGTDINSDGSLDILISDEDSGEIVWFKNDGNENFTEEVVDLNYTRAHTVFARDIDLDGDMDVLGTATSVSNLSWWENDGAQNFTRHNIDRLLGAIWVDMMDVDDDGDMDLYCAAMGDQSISLWENDGSEHFTKHLLTGSCQGGFGVISEDIDSDGDMDFVAVGYTSNKLVWFENNSITEVEKNGPVPSEFGLHQNYPNPFNPTTTINFTIPFVEAPYKASLQTELIIYDILGREVQTLLNMPIQPDNYEVTFNAADLPSGVYYYRLTSGEFSQTMKMLLLK